MVGVDDAETISVWVCKDDEIGVCRIRVPLHTSSPKPNQTVDLVGLLGCIVNDEVEMNSRVLLNRCVRALYRDSCALAGGWNQDRESVVVFWEACRFVAENVRPERDCPFDIFDTENDCSKAQHPGSLTQRL